MAEGQNKNFDLQQKALAEFELKDVKELLNKVKKSSFQVSENDLKKLDKDDNNLSETEKELLKKSKETLDMIKFLEGLIVELEKKEKKTPKLEYKGKVFNVPSMNKTNHEIIKTNNEEDYKKIDSILGEDRAKWEANLDNLLKQNSKSAKDNIKKLLDIDLIANINCRVNINFNELNTKASNIRDKILNKLNKDIEEKLKGYKINGEKIDTNILFGVSLGECNVDNLIKNLSKAEKDGRKLTLEEIQDIVFGVAVIKEDKNKQELRATLEGTGLTKQDLEGKKDEEIYKLLKEKGKSDKEISIIINNLRNIKETHTAKNINIDYIKKIKQTYYYMKLSGSYKDNFNKTSIEFFEKNPKEIINITDKNKLLTEVLNNEKIKNKVKDLKIEDFIDSSLLGDIDIILKILDFKKLNTYDLRNVGILEIEDLIKLSNKLGNNLSESTLSNFIIFRYDIEKVKKIYKDLFKKTNNNSDSILSKTIRRLAFFNEIETKNDLGGVYLDNLLNRDITLTDIKNNNSEKLKKGEGLSKKERLEYTLIYKMNINDTEAEKIMKLFSKDINLLYQFPLVIKHITSNKENINKMIEINPNFYINFLKTNYNKNDRKIGPTTIAQSTEINTNVSLEYNKKYIDSILNNPNITNKEKYLSKLKFSDFKQLLETFKYLKNKKEINFKKILGYEEIRNNLKSLQLNKKPEEIIKTLKGEDKELFMQIEGIINNFFSENIKKYTQEFNTKKNKYTIDKSKFENNKTINELIKQYPHFKKEIEQLVELIKGGEKIDKKDILAHFAVTFGPEKLQDFGNLLTKILEAVKKETTEKGKKSFNGLQETKKEELIKKDIYNKNGELTSNFKDKFKEFYISQIRKNKNLNNKAIIQLFLQKYKGTIKPNTEIFDSIKTQLNVLINSNEFEAIIKRINNAKTDEERRKLYSQIVNKDKEFYGSIKQEAVKSMETSLNNNSINNENGENNNPLKISTFSQSENNKYSININGEQITGLTQDEINDIGIKKDKTGNIIVENPDILENTINFYKFFKDLNLLGVWKYRKELTKSMGDININLEDDSLKKRELVKFGNKLIHFINNLPKNEKNKDIQLNENLDELSKIETELRKFSQANSMISSGKTFNNLGEDILTANLRDLGIIGGACFHTMQFRDIMNGNINSN